MQAGGERRGSNASKTGDHCMEEVLQQVIALGANRMEALFQRVRRDMGAFAVADAKKGRRNSEDEQEKEKPDSSWCYQRQAGSMKALQRAVWSLIFLVWACTRRMRRSREESGTAKDRRRSRSYTPRSRSPMEEDASLGEL